MTNEASSDTKEMLAEAIALHRDGDLTNSQRLYEKILSIDPKQTDALQLLGVIAAQLGNIPVAIERVNQSLAINPNQPSALNNLGNMLAELDRYPEAIDAYERAIHFDSDNAQTHFHLGHVLDELGRYLDAANAYKRATELNPDNKALFNALGAAQEKIGRFDASVDAYRQALAIDAHYIAPREGLGKALRQLGQLDEAGKVYRDWLELQPENSIAKHFACVCDAPEHQPARAAEDYVKDTFDVFADTFESLLADLDYRVPELLGQRIKQWAEQQGLADLRVVDLGCGTGLCGSHLRSVAGHLIGVDLSPGMLAKAAEKQLYDDLIEAELTGYLKQQSEPFDLMVSADTLIYIGDLRSTFAAAAAALRPGGAMFFSIEKMIDDPLAPAARPAGFTLGISGRYAHTEPCLRTWLDDSGFTVQGFEEVSVRREGTADVAGYLILAIRNESTN